MPTTTPIVWTQSGVPGAAARRAEPTAWARPRTVQGLLRGFAARCPCCGQGRLFTGWLRQMPECGNCHAPLGAVRADDAPPYFVIFIVAHVVIATQVLLEPVMALSTLAEAAIFMPLALIMCLGLLRPVKGATIGLMLHLGMVNQEEVGTGNA